MGACTKFTAACVLAALLLLPQSAAFAANLVIVTNQAGVARGLYTEDDVRTLMHEMGHAFQAWESQAIEAVDLQLSNFCELNLFDTIR